MADFLHDDIVYAILARLPAKSLLRFRCVSTHWNHMLRDPGFMKLRSRKTIIIPLTQTLQLIDDNTHLIVSQRYPLDFYKAHARYHRVIGTFNGLVLMIYVLDLILYNPFTGVSKKLPRQPTRNYNCAYGFGYGYGDERNLKVVRFRKYSKNFDVYNFKEGSWSTISYNFDSIISFERDVGTYTNGFLYWIESHRNVLIVVDVKDTILSEMNLPFEKPSLLGTMNGIGGCLCALDHGTMWVMKEHNQWSKMYSFKLCIPDNNNNNISYSYIPLCVLDSGRILMMTNTYSRNLIIYDPTKGLYDTLNMSLEREYFWRMHVLEYVESLVSPLDIMSRARRSIRKEDKIKKQRSV